jgi:hypothetical protein
MCSFENRTVRPNKFPHPAQHSATQRLFAFGSSLFSDGPDENLSIIGRDSWLVRRRGHPPSVCWPRRGEGEGSGGGGVHETRKRAAHVASGPRIDLTVACCCRPPAAA